MQMKPSALAGWTLFLLLLFLTVFYEIAGLGISSDGGNLSYLILGLTELLVFLSPTIFLKKYRPLHGLVDLRTKMVPRAYLSFVLCASLAIMFASFLLNCLCLPRTTPMGIGSYYPIRTGLGSGTVWLAVITLAILPAIAEELFLRGAIFSLYEKRGAATAMILSSLAFSMLHSSPDILLPTLAAGIGYAFLMIATDSIFAAIFAHLLGNLYSVLITLLAARYTYGVFWEYFIAGNVIAFFVFGYLAVRILRNLVREDTFSLPEKRPVPLTENLKGAVNSAGFILFCTLFLVRLGLTLLKAVL
ncbi:MAG: CPBP family intramembrane metalloprotease [Clostridia bacterium]|nr:CPBP family intramembrane metalloprotease [Clostridia bacterium]